MFEMQVPQASASSIAFGLGLFSEMKSFGLGKNIELVIQLC
jgi:hypothetical protein